MIRHWAIALTLLLPAALHAGSAPRLPVLPNEEAWKRLPGAAPFPQQLPAWARQLAGRMPTTTARMLELDALHRSGDRLDARLRSLVRWSAADALGCEYSKATATADLRRARNADADIAAIIASPNGLPALDRAAVAFARKMILEAHAVTDGEVKQLIELGGEERTMALVALIAHASFQDRVILALQPPAEPKQGTAPLAGRFARPPAPKPTPPKSPPKPESPPDVSVTPNWVGLQRELDEQRARPGRIRVPTQEQVLARIGDQHPGKWQNDILWSRVAYGYQPELTDAWFETVGAVRQDTPPMSPIFGNSVFWVVTQATKCFY